MGKNKFDRRIQFGQLMDKDTEEQFLVRVALNELKLSETDDLIVENESESFGENDVEEIEPEKAHEEKKKTKNKARSLTFSVLRSRIKERQ